MEKPKIYDKDFKEKAVQLGFEIGLKKAAIYLGIRYYSMVKWKKEYLKFGSSSFCGRGSTRLNEEQTKFSKLKRKLKNELKESELKLEIFKNGAKYISQGRLMLYQFIESNEDKYTAGKICKTFGISYLSYTKWKNQILSPRQRRNQLLKEEISSVFYEYKELYGVPRITAELQSRGFKVKEGRIYMYMKQLGLISKIRKDRRPKTSICYNPYAFPNILNQQFTVEESSRVWVSGINRIKTANGLLALTIIMDLFDMKIIGWSLSDGQSIKETTIPAWEMAVKNRKINKELIFHSNHGAQYANKIFTRKLEAYKFIKISMSEKGNYSDSSIAESFFNSLKCDLLDLNMLLSKEKMREKILEYLNKMH
ncbi:transposase InsO family protein/transposase-like protein [Flavobacterium nitrogenifigens]|uniref:Transposase InsO family protein/transposase-like protein n=2 Tax=Flavobacterium TaxID=237 RepID=A0A7W7J253_9FLAO|nr:MULTISPECIES: IS3 family transposase [Flavobacterium]MBB4804195.1 transposase InsO family protein/transposase-like protein [Flavobacterium nitrogenifigens]MBB6389154.1 transposase InsO family protein/transposase-like protein [Flavobacterium notoginsengisoli]